MPCLKVVSSQVCHLFYIFEYLILFRNFSTPMISITDEIRKSAWPMLLELKHENMEPCPDETEFKSHIEFSQVVLDVNRSIKRFPPGIPYNQRVAMQDQLIRLILRVITRHPQLQYYQVKASSNFFFSLFNHILSKVTSLATNCFRSTRVTMT